MLAGVMGGANDESNLWSYEAQVGPTEEAPAGAYQHPPAATTVERSDEGVAETADRSQEGVSGAVVGEQTGIVVSSRIGNARPGFPGVGASIQVMLRVLRLRRLLVVEAVDEPFVRVVEGDREECGASVPSRARNRAHSPANAVVA